MSASFLVFAAGLGVAWGVPQLVFVTDTAAPGLRVWWREGDLLVAPREGDSRPAFRPLAGSAAVVLPADPSGWTPLGRTCRDNPSAAFALDGDPAVVEARGPWADPTVTVRVGDQVVARARLGRPARLCDVLAGQADELPGPEVLVAWLFGEGAEEVRGLTVFRLPDTAR